MSQEAIKELREKAIAYIQNRYGSYLSSLLDQYDYDNQEDKTQKDKKIIKTLLNRKMHNILKILCIFIFLKLCFAQSLCIFKIYN